MSEGSIQLEEIISAITTPKRVNLAKSIFKTSEREKYAYYINLSNGEDYHTDIEIKTLTRSLSEYESYIESIIKSIDDIIDLDFERVDELDDSDIAFFSVDDVDPDDQGIISYAQNFGEGEEYGWWDIVLEQNTESSEQYGAIIRELGTILGLDNPENGSHELALNVDDTVMSYEIGESGWNTNFTEADIEALSEIWGHENDSRPDDITLSKSDINENIDASSAVASLSSSDPDAGDSLTYSLVSGSGDDDNSAFTIEGDQLKIIQSPDFESKSSYAIRLQTKDSGGQTFEKAFNLKISDLNETPTNISVSASTFNENIDASSAVASLSSSDPDAGDSLTYALVSGSGDDDNSAFTIEGDQLKIIQSPDFESKSSYTIRLQTKDSGGQTFEKAFNLKISDLNETPTNISVSASTFNENIDASSAVASLSSSDPDAGDSLTYALVSGSGDDDNSAFTIEGDQLKIIQSPDFESKSSYTIRLQTKDSGGQTFEKAFNLKISDLNETPTNISVSTSTFNENIDASSAVASLSSSDPDAGDSLTYALVSGSGDDDNSAFTIEGDQLKIIQSPDFESKSSYAIRLQTKDSDGHTFEKAFNLKISDLNETPTNISVSASTFNENIDASSAVASLSSSDPDAGDSLTYALVSGSGDDDNSAFTIEGDQLKIIQSPDFESKSSYAIRLQTKDSDGQTFEKAFNLKISDLNETPTNISVSASTFNENIDASSAVASLSSSDPDAGDSLTYALVSGSGDDDNSAFTIEGDQLKIIQSPDFESKSSYAIRLQTKDSGGQTFEKAFNLKISDLNETPTNISVSASTFNENIDASSAVASLSSSDPDAGDSLTYALVSGSGDDDNSAFTIEGDQLKIIQSPDFESKSSYTIRLQTKDSGGQTFEKAFNLKISDLNETPTNISVSTSTFNENIDASSAVASLSSSDPDAGDSLTYSLVSGSGDDDNSAFTIEGDQLKIIQSPDFESKSSYAIRLQTKDSDGHTFEKAFNLKISDLNETPTNISVSASTFNENIDASSAVASLSSSDPDAGDSLTYSLVSGSGDDDNSAFTIEGDQLKIIQSPDFESKSSYAIRLQTKDSDGQTFEKAFNLKISDLNETPTNISVSASTFNENIDASSAVASLSSSDPDAGDSLTYALVSGSGDDDNSAFTIEGDQLKIIQSPDFESKSSYAIRLQTKDSGGQTFEKAFNLKVSELNEGPTNISVSTSTFNENIDASSAVASLSSSDPDAGDSLTYALVSGSGDDDNSAFTIEGNQLKIIQSPDFESKSSYAIRLQTKDSDGQTFEKAFNLKISDLNETPTNISVSASTFNENIDASSAVASLSSSDPDAGDSLTYALVSGSGDDDNSAFTIEGNQLKIIQSPDFESKSSYIIRLQTKDSGGQTFEKAFNLKISDLNETPTNISVSASTFNENIDASSAVASLSSSDPDAGDSLTYALVSGSGDDDNSAFTIEGDQLKIIQSPDFESKSSYTIRLQTKDSGGQTFDKAFNLKISDLNETPTNISVSASTFNENIDASSAVASLSSSDPDAGDSLTYSLVSGSGDDDNSAFTIEGDQLKIIQSPDFESKSSYAIRLQTKDSGGQTFEKAFNLKISDLNETPTNISVSASTFNENIDASSAVASLSSSDPDAGDSLTYALVTGSGDDDNSAFTIEGNQLKIIQSPDFESKSSYAIRLQTKDSDGQTFEKAFNLKISDLNETPTNISVSASTFNENIDASSAVASLSSSDPDAGDSLTYALVSGSGDDDNSAFTIEGNQLKIIQSPDFESKSSYAIRLQTKDSGGHTFEKAFNLKISDLNETPTNISVSASTFNENIDASSAVASLSSSDPDAGDSLTYALVSGSGDDDNSAFTIEGNQLKIIQSPDFESKSSYTIRLQTKDSGGQTFEKAFNLKISDLNETPTNISVSASTFNENIDASSAVASLSSSDPDAGDSLTYSLVSGSGDDDNSAFTIEGDQLKIIQSPDFESKSSYAIRLQTKDSDGQTFEKAFNLKISDLNETPTNISVSASTFNENIDASSAVASLSSSDPDAGDSLTYSLVSGSGDDDNSAFTIEGDQLKIIQSPDFESKSSYAIRLQTKDSGGQTFEKAFNLKISDLNETPTNISVSASTFNENIDASSAVASLSSSDPDAGDSLTYSLVSGSGDDDNSAFTIEGNQLKIIQSPDFESKSSYAIRLQTKDSDGHTFEKAFNLKISDLNETPTNISVSASTFNENIDASSAVASLSSSDPDAGDSLTYALVSGSGDDDNSAFTIEGDQLKIIQSPDFESKSSYAIRLQTKDSGGQTFEKAFNLKVNDLSESKVDIKVLRTSNGYTLGNGDVVAVHYQGNLLSGEEFDANYDFSDFTSVEGRAPFEFTLGVGQVIQGWDQGLVGQQLGSVVELTIPAEQAYGETGVGDRIPPNSPLKFKVELLAALPSGSQDPVYWNFDDLGIDLETEGLLNVLIQTIDDLKIGLDNADLLNGSEKNDLLIGLDGGDYLNGGYGADVLIGGEHGDTFVYQSVQDSPAIAGQSDHLLEFESNDRINLSALVPKLRFIGSDVFSGTPGEVRFSSEKLELDQDGDRTADLALLMPGTNEFDQSQIASTFQINNVHIHSHGFSLQLNDTPNIDQFRLYSRTNSSDQQQLQPSLVLTDSQNAVVSLSAHWESETNRLHLLSDQALEDGDYNLRIRSDGLVSQSGNLLDGNGDGVHSDDYLHSFTHSTPDHFISVGDTARGAGQDLSVNGKDLKDGITGIPIHLSTTSSFQSVSGEISYDSDLLKGVSLAKGSDLPSDWVVNYSEPTPGTLAFTISGQSVATGSIEDTLRLIGQVDANASDSYGSTSLIQATITDSSEGRISFKSDPGLIVNAYSGDTTRNGSLSSLDASRVQRVVVGLDSGFDAFDDINPVLIGDTTGNGSLSSLDASRIQQEVVGLLVDSFPEIPVE